MQRRQLGRKRPMINRDRNGGYNKSRNPVQPGSILTPMRNNLDINCNVGQGFGHIQIPYEEEMFEYVTSINIACGMHSGDPKTMSRMIDLAKEYDVSAGALIGYPDIIGNGNREMYLEVDELRAYVLYQLGALNALLYSRGLEIRHVRAHGTLYKHLYTDPLIAETVAKAIAEYSKWIALVGLAGPILNNACSVANIRAGKEVLIDRRYRKDGTILPFSEVIDGADYLKKSLSKAREIIQGGFISCEGKYKLKINPSTIHLPSDREDSSELARAIRGMISDPKPLHLDKYDSYFADFETLSV